MSCNTGAHQDSSFSVVNVEILVSVLYESTLQISIEGNSVHSSELQHYGNIIHNNKTDVSLLVCV